MTFIIGITGRSRHGKDVVGQYLKSQYGYVPVAFADLLKQVCKILYNLNDDQLYGDAKDKIDIKSNKTPRQLFQFIGTDIFRKHVDDNFWIDRTLAIAKESKNVVITDVRFVNEAKSIKMAGGIIFKIIRPGYPKPDIEHESESSVDSIEYDHIIINDSDINTLYKKIDDYLLILNKK